MKKIAQFLIILVLGLSMFSCKKFLEIKPQQALINDSAMTTVKDLYAVLNGAYDGLQSNSVAGGDVSAFSDLMSDDFDVLPGRLNNFGTSEIYNGQTSVQIGALSEMWRQHYGVINRVNNVISVIDKNIISGPEFDAVKDIYKGEALFIRAYCNYNLLQMFALPYNVGTPGNNNQLGIVLRTEPTLNGPDGLSKARSTVEECYKSIIDDLHESFTLLNKAGKSTSSDRVSAMASQAMLARVLFTMGNYTDAANAADYVIASNYYQLANQNGADSTIILKSLIDPTNSAYMYNGKPEVIWQLVNTKDDNSGSLFGYYFPKYYMKVKSELINSIDSLDDRIIKSSSGSTVDASSVFVNPLKLGDWYVNKYRKRTGINYNNNIILLRLSEMYYIKAEAVALVNGVNSDALDAYNKMKLRNYGMGSYIPETTNDINDFLYKVRHERRIELMSENGDRYNQLKRLGLPLRDGTTNYAKYVFKIPQEEMASNTLIEQNP
ncbi:MAG: RagB/SusD family nutrient uptake outer membrane protein [Bacteroidia bacterium]|nr:RagB/SusD family nutrient uptake outer membrane protein [Bacteroidia bacterium]MCZ2248387.1 RagB/SusD family nutrient uptake outer membrane protein [Bacteroidia bacterium]